MHIVRPQHLQIPNCRSKILFLVHGWLNLRMQNLGIWKVDCMLVFIEKNLCVSGPAQFEPVLFKGQL